MDTDELRVFGKSRSPKWAAVRQVHLEEYPRCAVCGRAKHLEVHHVEPFHLSPELELDPLNLLTLCDHPAGSCHLIFGHYGDWSLWNPTVRNDAEYYRAGKEIAKEAAGKSTTAHPLFGATPSPTRGAVPHEYPEWAYAAGTEALRTWAIVFALVASAMFFAWLTH